MNRAKRLHLWIIALVHSNVQ